MPLPNTFAASNSPDLLWLDENFATLGFFVVVPAVVAGTNTITITPVSNAPTVVGPTEYQIYAGVYTAAANTGACTAQVVGLSAYPVYKQGGSGPVALTGGELIFGNLCLFAFNSNLNSATGGWVLINPALPPLPMGAQSSITSATGVTMTAAEMTGQGTGQGLISRAGSPSGGINDQSDTAAHLITALAGSTTGTIFRFRVINTSGQTVTLTTNTGITLAGTATTADSTTHDFIGIVTGAGAVTITG
jgi:hypothetical protein